MNHFIDLNDYEISGGGRLGDSYIRKDNPDILLKLYSQQREKAGIDEYERACKVFRAGIPCPEPGELVRTTDGRIGIQYKRVVGKKSYARAISEHPERLEEYTANFARICKKLHSIKPEPGMFPTAKEQYIYGINLNPFLTDDEKKGLERYIGTLPDADTAVHGDLHHGNIIFTEDGKQYFIDLGDFCTGTPLFDLGIVYRQTCCMSEEMIKDTYHIDMATSKAFWRAFVANYFGADVPVNEIEDMLEPYNCLRALTVEHIVGKPNLNLRSYMHKMIGMK